MPGSIDHLYQVTVKLDGVAAFDIDGSVPRDYQGFCRRAKVVAALRADAIGLPVPPPSDPRWTVHKRREQHA